MADQGNLVYCHCPEPGVFAPGRVRNQAVKRARGRFIFLFDADLLISRVLVESLAMHRLAMEEEGVSAFRMFPCLYLAQSYASGFSKQFSTLSSQSHLYSEVLSSYLLGELTQVDGIALASSCLLMRRDWFMALGGFSNEFAGHGCEDFDLIHRLAAFYPVGSKPDDYSVDAKHQFPGSYQGFRRYYSYYALPHLFEGNFLLHQWHPRPLAKAYHRKRKENEALFKEVLDFPQLRLPKPLQGELCSKEVADALAKIPFDSNKALPEFQTWIRQLQVDNGFSRL